MYKRSYITFLYKLIPVPVIVIGYQYKLHNEWLVKIPVLNCKFLRNHIHVRVLFYEYLINDYFINCELKLFIPKQINSHRERVMFVNIPFTLCCRPVFSSHNYNWKQISIYFNKLVYDNQFIELFHTDLFNKKIRSLYH